MSGNDRMRVVRSLGRDEWDAYVATKPEATGYHRWRWREIIETAFGHDTEYLAALRADTVVGILPLVLFRSRLFGSFMVSVPFVNYGGVIADDEEAADELLKEAERLASRGGFSHVELRHRERRFPGLVAKQ